MLLASLHGDTVVVYDFETARLSMFDGDGQYLRSVNYALSKDGVRFPFLVGMFPDGTSLVWSPPKEPRGSPYSTQQIKQMTGNEFGMLYLGSGSPQSRPH